MKMLLIFLSATVLIGKEIDNQTVQDLNHMPSIYEGAGVLKVPLVLATEESLAGYGRIVYDYDLEEVILESWPLSGWRMLFHNTGIGGVAEGSFTMVRMGNILYAENHALNRYYITGWFDDPAAASNTTEPTRTDRIYTHEVNYHPDGGQVFYPKDQKPFVALLAKPGDDVKPEDFVAFYFDGSFGVQILPNIWHQPVFPVSDEAQF